MRHDTDAQLYFQELMETGCAPSFDLKEARAYVTILLECQLCPTLRVDGRFPLIIFGKLTDIFRVISYSVCYEA